MNQGVHPPLPLGELSVRELIAAIGSDRPSPGAGAAGAIVLALAAACAAKAASIALKHRPDDTDLQRAVESFAQVARRALSAADADAAAFERFLHERRPNQAWQLILTDETLVQLSDELIAATKAFESRIEWTRAGDFAAARLLAQASRMVHERNIAEAKASSAGS
jgi:formiminotransferase-cyclodeaminase